mmetsp:Transcript_9969/g.40936  ORF Transcript_9969/g.40936 Transcript_9969/m.40936 type:complete len:268 (+) Transcript_9969:119-922(+)
MYFSANSLMSDFLSVSGTPNFTSRSPRSFFMETDSRLTPSSISLTACSSSKSVGAVGAETGVAGAALGAGGSSFWLGAVSSSASSSSATSSSSSSDASSSSESSSSAAFFGAAFFLAPPSIAFSSFLSSAACLAASALSSALIAFTSSGSLPVETLALLEAVFSFLAATLSRFLAAFSRLASAASLRFLLPDCVGFMSQSKMRFSLASFLPSSPDPRGRSKSSSSWFRVALNARLSMSSASSAARASSRPPILAKSTSLSALPSARK